MQNYFFYTTGIFNSAILPEKRVKFDNQLICTKTFYLTLPRVVTNGTITLRVSKLVLLGKIILRYLGWVNKLLVKSITVNVTLGKIALRKIILDRFRLDTVFLGNITLI